MWVPIILALSGVLWLIYSLMYFCECPLNGIRLKFKTFRSIYDINPDRWALYDGSVRFYKDSDIWGVSYRFGFFDFARYTYWLHCLDKQKKRKYEADKILELISTTRQDIAEFEQQTKNNTEKALRDIWLTRKEE